MLTDVEVRDLSGPPVVVQLSFYPRAGTNGCGLGQGPVCDSEAAGKANVREASNHTGGSFPPPSISNTPYLRYLDTQYFL